MIHIVLFYPENPGNIGAVCRVLKNFDFSSLLIIKPRCDVFSPDAKNRAKHAQDVLLSANISDTFDKNKFDVVIGTTGALGTDYNILRSPITPDNLVELNNKNPNHNIAIVFGPEGAGLSNNDLSLCDFVMSIPTSKKYPVLNLSHSVAIILYTLFDKSKSTISRYIPASAKDLEQLNILLNKSLDKMEFKTPEKRKTQEITWKRVFSKAMLTRREAFALMGYFKK